MVRQFIWGASSGGKKLLWLVGTMSINRETMVD